MAGWDRWSAASVRDAQYAGVARPPTPAASPTMAGRTLLRQSPACRTAAATGAGASERPMARAIGPHCVTSSLNCCG